MKSFPLFLCLPILSAVAAESIPLELSPFRVREVAEPHPALEIPESEIHLQRPVDLAEMLATHSPAVQLVRKGGAHNDLRLAGLGEDNLNVLQDGQRVYAACPNRMDPPASHTETTTIERIEVIAGAFDLRHAGALAGTVAITTRDPAPGRSGELDLTLGSFNLFRGGFAIEGGSADLTAHLSGGHAVSDAYEDGRGRALTAMPDASPWPLDDYLESARGGTAYRESRLTGKIHWQSSPEAVHRFQVGYRHATDVLYPALRMDADLNESISIAWKGDWQMDGGLADAVSLNLYYNSIQHDMSDRRRRSSRTGMGNASRPAYVLERGYYMQSLAENATGGLHLEVSRRIDDVVWRGGLEAFQRDWRIDNRLGAGMPQAGPAQEIFNTMIPETRHRVAGGFLEAAWTPTPEWSVSSGLRLDHYASRARAAAPTLEAVRGPLRGWAEDRNLSAKLMVRRSLSRSAFIYGGVGHTGRPPNGQERYLNLARPGMMPRWVGNPALEPTRLTELTAGAGWTSGDWNLHGRWFHRELGQYIYPVRFTTTAGPVQSYDAIDARLEGGEISVGFSPASPWSVRAAATWQRGTKESFLPGNGDPHLAEIPAASAFLEARYEAERWFAVTELRHFGAQDRIDEQLGERPLAGSTVVHLRAGWRFDEHRTLYLGIENLFDRFYHLHNAYVRNPFASDTVVSEPGRSLYVRWHQRF